VRGELGDIASAAPVERGPKDLRDLPEFFGQQSGTPADYGAFDIQIIAEINHAARSPLPELLAEARQMRDDGADIIDVGCDPAPAWPGVGDAVSALRVEGLRISVDSFNAEEVESALTAGAELVLSVNGTNVVNAKGWAERFDAEVVAIPDTPADLDS